MQLAHETKKHTLKSCTSCTDSRELLPIRGGVGHPRFLKSMVDLRVQATR